MISLKAQYGLKAIVSLAAYYGKGALQAKEIASSQNVPVRYLELLLSQLRRARLVDATRGKKGGYYLAKKPNTITVFDIVSAFEGNILYSAEGRENGGPLAFVWKDAEKMAVKYFKSIKISDLAPKLGSVKEMYHI
ncbi:MAG: Rrf2 family transcriptional regulator [Candidatus Zixiibacteriota bacterium]|nr:MAG: Rrf2 family transcriptional regulator [candidate division Zixibacteria bacterium]HDL04830.1 Rrf2 family transcriptional regulator [candidate division Zixibacteria bacterium]